MKTTSSTHVVLEKEVASYLSLIDTLFGLEKILSSANNNRDIVTYYRASHGAYKILHSRRGAIHMALSSDRVEVVMKYQLVANA